MRVPRIRFAWRSLSAPAIALALAGALTVGLAAAPLPVQAADTPEITDMTEQDYKDLGLTVDEEIPADTTGPYAQNKKTTVVTRNEVYMAANGANGNRYTLRDVLENVETPNKGKDSKLKDGNGNIWGAAKFWQNVNDIDHGSDLYKQSNYGGGDWSHLSDNGSETVLANEESDFSGIHATSTELCLKASTGKDSYVAELRAYGDNLTTDIKDNKGDTKSYKGKILVKLFRFDAAGMAGKRVWIGDLTPSVNTNMVTEDGEFKYLRAGYLQELDAVFNITAGDVDGDGVDEIFVYTGCYVDEGGRRMAVIDMFDTNGDVVSEQKHLVLKVDAGAVSDFHVTKKGNNDIRWTQLQSCPVVTLATGDFDRDFKDDLAITVSAPYAKDNIKESTYCELFTWDEEKSALTQVGGLGNDGKISLSSDTSTMVGASAAFGTFTAYDEEGLGTAKTVTGLIMAGYDWSGNGSYAFSSDWMPGAGYRFAYYDLKAGEFKLSDYQVTSNNAGIYGSARIPMTAFMDSTQDKRYPCTLAPIALCTANLDGLATPVRNDTILIGGDIYRNFACTVGEGANGLGNYIGTISMSGQHYNASNKYDHKGIDHVWISDVKAGCVSGSNDYRESFIAIVGSHRDEDLSKPDDYYWMTASHATLLANGTLNTGEEEIITESNRRNTRYGTFVSLSLPDVDKDSVQIEFEDAYKVYTNPKVFAVLQDAPYYQELEDSFGYLVLGGTGYGQSEGTGSSNGGSIALECGVAAETKTGAPLIVGELSIDVASEKGYEYQKETNTTFSIAYESHAGEGDKAVVYTIPMVYYIYNATNEETGETGVVSAPVALGPETSVVSIETYDRIAKRCLMTPLSYFLENKSGKPTTYESHFSAGTDRAIQDSFGLGKPGVERVYTGNGFVGCNGETGASISQEIEIEESEAHSLEIGLGINGSFLGGAKLGKHEFLGGIVFGLSGGYAHEWVSSEGQSFGGTVDDLPKEAKGNYGFQWRLGVNAVDRDNFEDESDTALGSKDTDKFWIVGYDLRDVQQPMAPAVTGFMARSSDDSSVTLAWDDVLPEDGPYSYGIVILSSNTSDPTMGDREIVAPGTTEFTWGDLDPEHNYRFVIMAVDAAAEQKGIRSAVVSATTLPQGMKFTMEGPQADVVTDVQALSQDVGSGLRYDTLVAVQPGANLTLKALGHLTKKNAEGVDEEVQLKYTWMEKKRDSETWEYASSASDVLAIEAKTDPKDDERDMQYKCMMGHLDLAFETSATTVKIERPESQLTTTNRERPVLKRLASLFGSNARAFLDHTQVNTAGPSLSDPTTPTDPATPTDPEKPGKTDGQTKPSATTTVTATKMTTKANLSNTGDKTLTAVAILAVMGAAAFIAGLILKRRNH